MYDQDEVTAKTFRNKNVPIIALTSGEILNDGVKTGLCTTKVSRLFVISYNLQPVGTIDYDDLDSKASKIQLLIQNGIDNNEIFDNAVELEFKDSPGSGKLMRVANNREIQTGSYASVVNFELKYNLEDVT
jgi:hypothetical protein